MHPVSDVDPQRPPDQLRPIWASGHPSPEVRVGGGLPRPRDASPSRRLLPRVVCTSSCPGPLPHHVRRSRASRTIGCRRGTDHEVHPGGSTDVRNPRRRTTSCPGPLGPDSVPAHGRSVSRHPGPPLPKNGTWNRGWSETGVPPLPRINADPNRSTVRQLVLAVVPRSIKDAPRVTG